MKTALLTPEILSQIIELMPSVKSAVYLLRAKALQSNVAESTAKKANEYASDLEKLFSLLEVTDEMNNNERSIFTPNQDAANKAALILGAIGGKSRSKAKIKAARENGKKGGRPRKAR